jgi:hypothetical protein
MPLADVYPSSHADPIPSIIVIGGLTLALLALAVVGLVRSHRRRALAEAADASFDPERLLAPGETVLYGTVEHAEDESVAVRVEITQEGEEKESSGSWSHSWTEIDRKIIVAPFYLRLAGGQRVRVEPPDDVDVADDLDRKVLIARDRRVLSAELVPGETIYARARLEHTHDPEAAGTGYRAMRGWRLIAAHGRMLLSSHGLGDGLRGRARFHRNAAIQLLGLLAAIHLLFTPYYVRAGGTVEEAEVTRLNVRVVEDDDGKSYHHEVTLRFADGSSDGTEVSSGDYVRLSVGTVVKVRRGSIDWQIGARPTLHAVQIGFGIAALVGLGLLQRSWRERTRPWYRRRVGESASGRLPGP